MPKPEPRRVYEIEAGKMVAYTGYSGVNRSLVIQQEHPLGGDSPDLHIYLNRESAEKLAGVLDQWLNETEETDG